MKDALVIEREDYCDALARGLKAKGLFLKTAPDVELALELLKNDRFAVIVADFDMVAESVPFWETREKYAPAVPTLLACERPAHGESAAPVHREIHDVIFKPYDVGETLAIIQTAKNEYLEKKQIISALTADAAFAFASSKHHAGVASAYIRKFIAIHGDGLVGFTVAIEEALVNAVVHGNGNDIDKKVHVALTVTPDRFEAAIEDEGAGFDFASVVERTKRRVADVFAENGRGLFLIARHTDAFEYENDGRRIRLVKKRK